MNVYELKMHRVGAGLTQTALAELMGIPLRTYQDLEGGKAAIRQIHVNALYYALIVLAAHGEGADQLPDELAELVKHAYLGHDAK